MSDSAFLSEALHERLHDLKSAQEQGYADLKRLDAGRAELDKQLLARAGRIAELERVIAEHNDG